VVESPLLDALDILLAFEVIEVIGFLPPASLTLGFADTAALGLGAVALAPDIAVIGMEKAFTVRTFTFSSWICHRPGLLQPMMQKRRLGRKKTGKKNRMRKKR
jgi:hypothetical protein